MLMHAEQILATYVKARAAFSTAADVEKDAECLIIASGNRLLRVREWAGKALATIAASFPSILWSRQLICTMLDVLLALLGGSSASLKPSEVIATLISDKRPFDS